MALPSLFFLLLLDFDSTSSPVGVYGRSGVNQGTTAYLFAVKMEKPNFLLQETELLV